MQTVTALQKKEQNKSAELASSHQNNTPVDLKEESGTEAGVPLFLQRFAATSHTAPPPIQRQPDEEEDIERIPVLPKLTVGAPDDKYERQADQVADKVMRMPNANGSQILEEEEEQAVQNDVIRTKPITPLYIQRAYSERDEEIQPKSNLPKVVQAKPDGSFSPSKKVAKILQSSGSGSPLPKHVRSKVEPVLGSDLSHVKIHSDTNANQAAKSINTKAFTHQNNIFLGKGQSANDLSLMAHEATHVVQQSHSWRSLNTRYIQRAAIKNALGKPVLYEFRVGTEVTQSFVTLAQNLAKDGEIDKTDLIKLRDHALLASETVRDTERMFMAGLLNATNVKTLSNTVINAGAKIVFPLTSISRTRLEEIINLNRPSYPEHILKQWQTLQNIGFPGLNFAQQPGAQPMAPQDIFNAFSFTATTLSMIEINAMFEIMNQAGPYVNQAAELVNYTSGNKEIFHSYVLMAMIAAASDNTPADKVMAGIVYAIAESVNHPLKNYLLAGMLKVDALSPAVFATVTGVPDIEAGYVPTAIECTQGRPGCGLKGDTLYIKTNLSINDTYQRSMVIHELEHALEDKTASKGAVVIRKQVDMELRAFGAQARFLLDSMLKQNRAQRIGTVQGIATSGIANNMVQFMFVEAMIDPEKYVGVLQHVCGAVQSFSHLSRERILRILNHAQSKQQILNVLKQNITQSYSQQNLTLTGLSGESYRFEYIQQLWDQNKKGTFFEVLRRLSPEERKDQSIENFIKENLKGDDQWLALKLFKYGKETGADSQWPLRLRIKREMMGWIDCRGKGGVFEILRNQHRINAIDLFTKEELAEVRNVLQDIFVAGSDDLWLAENILEYGPEDQWPAYLKRERMIKGMAGEIDYSKIRITAGEASVMTQEELQGELNKLKMYFKQEAPLTALYDVISKNIHILEEKLANRKLELETARKGYKSIYDGFMVAVQDNFGNLLIRNKDGTTFTISSWKEKLRLTTLPKAKSGLAGPGVVGFKFSIKKYLDPIKRYYPDPIYRIDAPKFHNQLILLKKAPDSMNYAEINQRLQQINSVFEKIVDTEPVYPHLLKESSILIDIVKKRAKEIKEKTEAIRKNPQHVDNNIAKLEMFVAGFTRPNTMVDFVYVKVTYKNDRILWLSLTYSHEDKIWKMKESIGQNWLLYFPRTIPSELRIDTAPNIFNWFYRTYPGAYSKRVQRFLQDAELFKQAAFSFSEILSMNLMGLNPYWAAVYLGYEGITGKRVFSGEEVPTWERILNIAMLAAPVALKKLKFRRTKLPGTPAGEIPAKTPELPVKLEKGRLINTKNKRELFIDNQGIIRYQNTKRICSSCNPDYYHLKGGRWRRRPGIELPAKPKPGKKVDFSKIAGKQAVPYNPEIPATRLGLDTSKLSKFGPYTNSEVAVKRILRKKTLDGIKGQLAEEVVNTIGTSEAAKIKPKFTEKGSTMKFFRGDEVAAPAPKQKSAGAKRADITDGIVAEIYKEGGQEKLYIHRFYEVKSGSASAQKLGVQVGWDMERIMELGISVKVPKPGGGFVWKDFAPRDISMVPRASQSSVAKGFVPTGVKAPKTSLTEQFQAFEIPGITEMDFYEAALMILRQKGGGH